MSQGRFEINTELAYSEQIHSSTSLNVLRFYKKKRQKQHIPIVLFRINCKLELFTPLNWDATVQYQSMCVYVN